MTSGIHCGGCAEVYPECPCLKCAKDGITEPSCCLVKYKRCDANSCPDFEPEEEQVNG